MKQTITFQQLSDWYLKRLAEEEELEAQCYNSTRLSQLRAIQRALSDGLRLLREVMETGFELEDRLPEDLILPKDFRCP